MKTRTGPPGPYLLLVPGNPVRWNMSFGPKFRTTSVIGAAAGGAALTTGVTGSPAYGAAGAVVTTALAQTVADFIHIVLTEFYSEPGDEYTTNWLHHVSYGVLLKVAIVMLLTGCGVAVGYGDTRLIVTGGVLLVVAQIGGVVAERMEGRSVYENGKEEMVENGYGWLYQEDRNDWEDPEKVEIDD